MDKQVILAEIKRTAELNGGKALGIQRFTSETGIRRSDWYGVHWAAWGETVAEAGLEPNSLTIGLEEERLIALFVETIREVGAWPSEGKLRLVCRQRTDLPNGKTFRARMGNNAEFAKKILAYCKERDDLADIATICEPIAQSNDAKLVEPESTDEASFGYVYLMKSGKFHKIGRSNSVGRREYELGTKLPEELTTIYSIQTDDPVGIERYWHERFADKRKEGEWFALSAADVAAFKRWRRIH